MFFTLFSKIHIFESIVFIHTTHVSFVDISTRLSDNSSCFFSSNFSNFNLSFPILDAIFKLLALVLLLNKFNWIRHVLNLLLQSSLSSIVGICFLDILLRLFDCFFSFLHLLLLNLHLDSNMILFSNGVS